jgi:hypothetical protein
MDEQLEVLHFWVDDPFWLGYDLSFVLHHRHPQEADPESFHGRPECSVGRFEKRVLSKGQSRRTCFFYLMLARS